jgi:hypothetical protein
MNQDSKRQITLEDILRLKRAERPFQLRLVATVLTEIVGNRWARRNFRHLDYLDFLGRGLIDVSVEV